jgi:hypothetical protein
MEIPFTEHPRITRFRMAENALIIWFSVPMNKGEMIQCKPVLRFDQGTLPARLDSVEEDGHCFRFILAENVSHASGIVLELADWPTGLNGMELTSWGSALRVLVNQ